MKKVLILILVLVPCLPLVALDFGFALDETVFVQTEKQDSLKASLFSVELMPAVVIMLNPQLEARPYLLIGYQKEDDPDGISGAIFDDWSQLYFGVGAGLYYHFVQREIITICAGPKALIQLDMEPKGTSAFDWDSYLELAISIGLPVYFDVRLTDRLYFRSGIELMGLGLSVSSRETGGVKTTDSVLFIMDYWPSVFGFFPYFGFYFML